MGKHRPKPDTAIEGGELVCRRCGQRWRLTAPRHHREHFLIVQAFDDLHRWCVAKGAA